MIFHSYVSLPEGRHSNNYVSYLAESSVDSRQCYIEANTYRSWQFQLPKEFWYNGMPTFFFEKTCHSIPVDGCWSKPALCRIVTYSRTAILGHPPTPCCLMVISWSQITIIITACICIAISSPYIYNIYIYIIKQATSNFNHLQMTPTPFLHQCGLQQNWF